MILSVLLENHEIPPQNPPTHPSPHSPLPIPPPPPHWQSVFYSPPLIISWRRLILIVLLENHVIPPQNPPAHPSPRSHPRLGMTGLLKANNKGNN